MFDLIIEPDIDRLIDQTAGNQRQQNGGNQRKSDEGRDQLRPEPGPHKPMPPFEVGFDEVAGQEQREDDEPDQVEIDQQQHEGIPGAGKKGIRLLPDRNGHLGIVEGKRQAGQQQDQDDPDRPNMALAPLALDRGRRRRLLFAQHPWRDEFCHVRRFRHRCYSDSFPAHSILPHYLTITNFWGTLKSRTSTVPLSQHRNGGHREADRRRLNRGKDGPRGTGAHAGGDHELRGVDR